MNDKAETLELLSAYVCGDVTPSERAAVELLLSGDTQSRALVDELRQLSVTLAAGRKPLHAELLNTLRRHVEARTKERAEAESVEALVSASLSGDVNARERSLLEKHLNSKPQARAELNSLRELSVHLTRAELPAGDELSKKLAERLNAKLPAAARVGQPAKTSVPKTQSDRPSLRVYAAPENPWRRVALASAAIAALVAMAFGLAHLLNAPANTGISKGDGKDPVKDPLEIARQNPEKQNNSPEERTNVPPNDSKFVDRKPDTQPKIVPFPDGNPVPDAPQVVRDDSRNSLDPNAPKVPDKIVKGPKTLTPLDTPANTNNPEPKVADKINSSQPVPPPKPNDLQNIPGPNTVGPIPAPNPNPNSNPNSNPNPNPNPAIKAGATDALVAVVRDGNATVEVNGQRRTLKNGEVLPSGSSVITDVSRVALDMPGGAKLYINRGSRVTVNMAGGNDIALSSGEISYIGAKTATINTESKNVSIKRASQVNVKMEGTGVVASVMAGTADISSKGKTTSAKSGDKVAAGNDGPKKDSFTGQPDPWRNDMGDDPLKTPTDDKDAKEKNRGGRGRKK